MRRFPLGKPAIALAVVFGILVGVGAFTFNYAEGLSYFSTDPKACVNCHIMNDEYDSWIKSPHHGVAKCVDCHLPHEMVPKLIAKSENGWHHSKAFTLQDFHQPIMITPRNAQILQESCVRCHENMVHDIVAGKTERDAVKCVHCHKNVGHAATR
jgi:cytochrome c nitrite reductase small subunit